MELGCGAATAPGCSQCHREPGWKGWDRGPGPREVRGAWHGTESESAPSLPGPRKGVCERQEPSLPPAQVWAGLGWAGQVGLA